MTDDINFYDELEDLETNPHEALVQNINALTNRRSQLEQEQIDLETALEEKLTASGLTEDQAASPHRNQEGRPAFQRGTQERAIQVLTTNTLSNTFYVKKEEIKAETIQALEEIAKENPEFLAKALVYAREEGLLQLVPTLGLAILSKTEDKSLFKKVFPRIISTPDNLRAFVKICKSGEIREGFGGVATEAVKEWLSNLSEYQAVKYSGDAKSKRNEEGKVENNFSLRDLIVLARPKPETPEMTERYRWLVRGAKDMGDIAHNPKIKAYEELKTAETDEERIALIKAGNLPWEVVIPAVPKMTPELWEAVMTEMPYMALLRNINNLSKYGVLDSPDNVAYLVHRLTDAKAIKKSKILPFRFFEAYQAYAKANKKEEPVPRWGLGRRRWYPEDEGDETEETPEKFNSQVAAALEEALEASFVNMPELRGEIAIASDVSGSMGSKVNDKGQTRYIDICGVFTGALLKKATDRVHALPFDDHVRRVDLSSQDRILTNANKLIQIYGGGTALGAPIEQLLRQKQSVDTFIGITDNEEWAYGSGFRANNSFLSAWRKYLKEVNPEAQAYLIRIDPYKDAVAPQEEPNVHFIYGWSDSVLNYIGKSQQDKESQVETVEKIEL